MTTTHSRTKSKSNIINVLDIIDSNHLAKMIGTNLFLVLNQSYEFKTSLLLTMDLKELICENEGVKECLELLPDASDTQIAAFLTWTAVRPWTVENMIACANFMRSKASVIDLPDGIDLVGTGGDGHSTINVSTISSLVAASLGIKITKHGSRSSSSKCGSADFLEALGYDFMESIESIQSTYDKHNFAFLYAPKFHPTMNKLKCIRKELGFPTLFNIMGPLTNPSNPSKAVIGVAKPEWGLLMAKSLIELSYEKAMVVCGHECLDEISPSGFTHVWYVENKSITTGSISPKDFNLECHSLASITGGDSQHNLSLFQQFLSNCDDVPAIRDVICINVAALLWVNDSTPLAKGAEITLNHIKSGKFEYWLGLLLNK